MQSYEPSPFTALAVYVFAAAHKLQSDNIQGSFAVCSYNPKTELWQVILPDGDKAAAKVASRGIFKGMSARTL